jgi:hypothetical protein
MLLWLPDLAYGVIRSVFGAGLQVAVQFMPPRGWMCEAHGDANSNPKHTQSTSPAQAIQSAVFDSINLFSSLMSIRQYEEPERFAEWVAPLQGKDLACWCPLNQTLSRRHPTAVGDMTVEDFDPSDPDIDWVVVMRALNGEKVHANQAEKLDIIRRWQASRAPPRRAGTHPRLADLATVHATGPPLMPRPPLRDCCTWCGHHPRGHAQPCPNVINYGTTKQPDMRLMPMHPGAGMSCPLRR